MTEPPVQPEDDLTPPSKWPKVLGIVSLIYALGGLLCYTGQGAWLLLAPVLPKLLTGGIEMPPFLRYVQTALVLVTLVIGIVMLAGAINLLRRRRVGVRLLRRWAVARLIMLVIGVLVFVATSGAQLEVQRQRIEFQNDMQRQAGRPDKVKEPTDEELWRTTIAQTAVATAVFAFFPVFIGLYLSRRKVNEEIEVWE